MNCRRVLIGGINMSDLQKFEKINQMVLERFSQLFKSDPDQMKENIKLSWSNWGFGQEDLEQSAKRLQKAGIHYIELHGNRYGDSLGYDTDKVKRILDNSGLKVSGICGMFTPQNDLSSNQGWIRQEAIDYLNRNIDLGYELGAEYFLIVPGAVGRPNPIDEYELNRSIESLSKVVDKLEDAGMKGAIEPIRAAEVSFCHTFKDAIKYINLLDHPAVQWINGDVYHMIQEETHIGKTIMQYGDRLINLHLADTNRGALGEGMLNLDILLKSLYIIGYNMDNRYATPEPLGPGGDPYPAMHGKQDPKHLDQLVNSTVEYLRKREKIIKKSINE